MKHVIPFRGIKMSNIRTVLHKWYTEEQIASNLSKDQHLELALQLFERQYEEDKLAGILFLQVYRFGFTQLCDAHTESRTVCTNGSRVGFARIKPRRPPVNHTF